MRMAALRVTSDAQSVGEDFQVLRFRCTATHAPRLQPQLADSSASATRPNLR